MGPVDDPFAVGLGPLVPRSPRADFVGLEALEELREANRDRKLVSLHVPDAVLWHGESVLRGDERRGHVTSAALAPTLGGGSAGLAWVDGGLEGDGWGVEIRGEAVPAVVQESPFYDPSGSRLRS
jgi:dimethylglycine dehydrogenase